MCALPQTPEGLPVFLNLPFPLQFLCPFSLHLSQWDFTPHQSTKIVCIKVSSGVHIAKHWLGSQSPDDSACWQCLSQLVSSSSCRPCLHCTSVTLPLAALSSWLHFSSLGWSFLISPACEHQSALGLSFVTSSLATLHPSSV